jgi:hypothetical protein
MLREEVGDDIDDSFTISAFWILLCHFWHLVFYHFSGKHGLSRMYFPDYKLQVYLVWNLDWQLQTLWEVTQWVTSRSFLKASRPGFSPDGRGAGQVHCSHNAHHGLSVLTRA